MNNKVEFTGVVVTCNEERYLRDCLNSLAFCQQLIVIDLGSTDSSLDIAVDCGAEIIHREWGPVVEPFRKEAIEFLKYDWMIQLDPDEIFPANIEDELRSMIMKDSELGVINIPWKFYIKGKPLNFSIWGLEKTKGIVLHKSRNKFTALSQRGTKLLNGYTSATLPGKSATWIRHYWVDSYEQLFEKHWRYIKKEGESRYLEGERFSWVTLVHSTISALKSNLIDFKGLRGGALGIFLSFFYSWYICMSLLSLLRYQNRITNKNPV
jgi:glycosyltransferase involved in cell wall biosynthesis